MLVRADRGTLVRVGVSMGGVAILDPVRDKLDRLTRGGPDGEHEQQGQETRLHGEVEAYGPGQPGATPATNDPDPGTALSAPPSVASRIGISEGFVARSGQTRSLDREASAPAPA
jgi:hypothetical protein